MLVKRKKGRKQRLLVMKPGVPLVGAGMLAMVLMAVAVGRMSHPAGHAATDPGNIRTECSIDHFGPDDPIVYPGTPGASHMHSFFGNSTTNAFTTPTSLMANPSSCDYIGDYDRSAYWVPSLYFNNSNGTSTQFTNPDQQLVIYYRRPGGANGPLIKPFPVGLRMIAGDAKASSPQPQSISMWDCGDGGPTYSTPPDCTNASSGNTPVGFIEFPNCWDGVHLDSADHKSHMAYADPNTGACPADHPVSLPQLHYEMWERGTTGAPNMTLSSGSYSLHGDFFAAWDSRLLSGVIDTCLNTFQRDCSVVQVWGDNNVAPHQTGDVTYGGTFLFNINDPKYAASPTPTPSGSAKPGDINGDGAVNVLDLSNLLSAWGKSTAGDDLNNDGTVNVLDLSIMLSHWGT